MIAKARRRRTAFRIFKKRLAYRDVGEPCKCVSPRQRAMSPAVQKRRRVLFSLPHKNSLTAFHYSKAVKISSALRIRGAEPCRPCKFDFSLPPSSSVASRAGWLLFTCNLDSNDTAAPCGRRGQAESSQFPRGRNIAADLAGSRTRERVGVPSTSASSFARSAALSRDIASNTSGVLTRASETTS